MPRYLDNALLGTLQLLVKQQIASPESQYSLVSQVYAVAALFISNIVYQK